MQVIRITRLDRIQLFKARKYQFMDYFKDFEKISAVRRIFGEMTETVLRELKVEFTWIPGYMWTNNVDGHITISSRYLSSGSRTHIYLDIIHELVHVKQHLEGKELFDAHYDYAERPTEIEAYKYAVDEARRLGLSDMRICEYLKTEWMTNHGLKRLAHALKVKCDVK